MSDTKFIDISEHNGNIDWESLSRSIGSGELSGVIIRAGYGTATGMKADSRFATNCLELRKRNIPRGFYGFAYPGRSDGVTQARGLLDIVGELQPGENLILDIEDETAYGRDIISSDVQWCSDFAVEIKKSCNIAPIIYMNSDLLNRYDWSSVVGKTKLWIASYGSNDGSIVSVPSAQEWGSWMLWQYTSRGSMASISPVDINLLNGQIDAFSNNGPIGTVSTQLSSSVSLSASLAGNGSTYTIAQSIPGYVTADDAKNGKNSNSSVPAGSYFVFNQSSGMVNVTRSVGTPGWWINPTDNKSGTPSPAPASYVVSKGDTVDGICDKYGISKGDNYRQFRSMNPYSGHTGDWSNLWPGDKVRVK